MRLIRGEPERAATLTKARGQALVEFALVVPVLALVLAATVQLGLIYERQIGIENAVRDAARRAATFETTTQAQADVNGPWTANLLLGPGGLLQSNAQGYDGLDVVYHDDSVCYRTQLDAAGQDSVMVKVTVEYKHPLFLPIISAILDGMDGIPDNALHVTTSSEFQVQNSTAASVAACYN